MLTRTQRKLLEDDSTRIINRTRNKKDGYIVVPVGDTTLVPVLPCRDLQITVFNSYSVFFKQSYRLQRDT